jgi:hypothetical protein
MDITTIKNIFVTYLKPHLKLSVIWNKVKEAIKLPYAKLYIAGAVVMTLVFMVVTFPYDMLIRKQLKNLERTAFKAVSISEIDVGIFNTTQMNNIYILTQGGNEITVKGADFDISLLRLLIQKNIKGTIQLTGFKYASPSTQMTFNLNGNIFIDYKSFSEMPQGGSVKIMIDNAALKITDMALPDSMGGLPITLPLIRINSITMEADISGNRVTVRNIRIFGKDLSGSITGSLTLQKNWLNTGLDLKMVLNANTPVLDSYRDFLSKYINDRNQLVLALRGSVMIPRFEFSQGDSGGPVKPEEHPIDKIIPVQ